MIIFKTIPKVVRNCAKVSITLSLIIAFFAISFIATNATAADPMKARLSYHWYPKHHSAQYAEKFAEAVEKATDVEIDTFGSGQLYGIREAISAVSSGSVEMAGVLDIIAARAVDEFSISYLPYFWDFGTDGYEQMQTFYREDPEAQKVWKNAQEKLGIKILASIPVGPSGLWTTFSLDDGIESLKGEKARYLSANQQAVFDAFGMDMVSVQTSEVYSALKQGMIDAASTNSSAVLGYSWDDYFTNVLQPWLYNIDAWVIANGEWWESLPEETRRIIEEEVSPKISKECNENVLEIVDGILEDYREEGTIEVYELSKEEIEEVREQMAKEAWPEMTKKMDPDFVKAAYKYTGNEKYIKYNDLID